MCLKIAAGQNLNASAKKRVVRSKPKDLPCFLTERAKRNVKKCKFFHIPLPPVLIKVFTVIFGTPPRPYSEPTRLKLQNQANTEKMDLLQDLGS